MRARLTRRVLRREQEVASCSGLFLPVSKKVACFPLASEK